MAIVKEETAKAETLFVGDGINAPALLAATVGVAFGSQNDTTTEAADAVGLETALGKIDELMHIGQRMRRIALQSALGEWRPACLEWWRQRSFSCHQSGKRWGRN